MAKNKPTTTGQGTEPKPAPKNYIPGDKTTIRLEDDTLAFLKQCEGMEARRRGTSWIKHDRFIMFLCLLYEKAQARDECKTVIYLAYKAESE
jgi:hypothetical protein